LGSGGRRLDLLSALHPLCLPPCVFAAGILDPLLLSSSCLAGVRTGDRLGAEALPRLADCPLLCGGWGGHSWRRCPCTFLHAYRPLAAQAHPERASTPLLRRLIDQFSTASSLPRHYADSVTAFTSGVFGAPSLRRILVPRQPAAYTKVLYRFS